MFLRASLKYCKTILEKPAALEPELESGHKIINFSIANIADATSCRVYL